MIRPFEKEDLPVLMDLWLSANMDAHAFGAAGFFDKQAFDMGAVYADKAVDGGGGILLTDIYFCPGQLGAPLAGMFRSV